jgi:F420-dependent oxidoreductase-like protein
MQFSLWQGPHQAWAEVLRAAAHAERTGWDGIWSADHLMPLQGDAPTIECWAGLAGLATAVDRVRIGSLVSGNTYRHPAVLAKMAATVDRTSGGRLVLGIGAGWQRNEHEAYGIDFFDVRQRLARLDEACQMLKALFANERTDFSGRYYTLRDAPLDPKPLQQPLPLLVGGAGERVTLKIAARYCDEWNTWGTPEVLAAKGAVLDRHCEAIGRDPATIRRSAQALVFLSEDEAWLDQVRQRMGGAGRPTVIGTPDEVQGVMADYVAAGVDEFVVPDFNLTTPAAKTETMDMFIERVAPALR